MIDFLRNFSRFWPWLAAVSTGLLCTLCFAPFDQNWLAWFALTPLLAAIWFSGGDATRRPLRNLALGYVAGLTFFWTVFSWLTTVTVPGWFLLQFYMAIYFALFAWFVGLLTPRARPAQTHGSARVTLAPKEDERTAEMWRSPYLNSFGNLGLAFLVAAGWVAQEWIRSWFLTGWGWNTLGSALWNQITLIQIVEYTGVPGLSFITAFANVIAITTARRIMLEMHVRPVKPHYDLTITGSLILGMFAFGLRQLQERPISENIRVALLQPNIPQEEKFRAEHQQKTFELFTRLTDVAVSGRPVPDLVIWPEAAMPQPVLTDQANYDFVFGVSRRIGSDLLLGSLDHDETGFYNAALLFAEGGERVHVYRKLHLVPFGEYIPGRHTVPLLAWIVGEQVPDDFAVGKEAAVFKLTGSEVRVAPLICFEDTLGELTRRFVLNGANLLANVTNDGWFKQSQGARQHLANAVFRCIETRRPMVRSANTGVTCIIDVHGRIKQQLADENGNHFVEGVLTGEVAIPRTGELTFYTRHGEIFPRAAAAVAGLTLLVMVSLRLFQRRRAA